MKNLCRCSIQLDESFVIIVVVTKKMSDTSARHSKLIFTIYFFSNYISNGILQNVQTCRFNTTILTEATLQQA